MSDEQTTTNDNPAVETQIADAVQGTVNTVLGSESDNQNDWRSTLSEDLKNDPEYELKKILNILNLKYDLDKLKSAIVKNDFKNITNRVPGHQDLNSFARKGVIGDWKNHFNENSVEISKKLYGEELIFISII